MSKAVNITQRQLKNRVDYNHETGLFTDTKTGKLMGTYDNGYYKFQINKMRLFNHQWAWLYCYGYVPAIDIDHINGNKSDNRISNLREVTRSQNLQNIKNAPKTKKSGLPLGVSKNGTCFTKKPYRAHLYINGKHTALGSFSTAEEAEKVYIETKLKHHSGYFGKY